MATFQNYISDLFINMVSKILWNYNTLIVFCERKLNHIYVNNELIRNSVDFIKEKTDYVMTLFDNSLKEPPYACWINSIHCIETDDIINYNDDYIICEKINCLNNEDYKDIVDIFNNELEKSYKQLIISDEIDKNMCCVIGLIDKKYMILSNSHDKITFEVPSVQVISIFYNHPLMEENIQLIIPKEYIYVNNTLLNCAFVLRCLKMQKESFIFDKNYFITIMDEDINEYEIRYNQYLHVNKDTFEIKSY